MISQKIRDWLVAADCSVTSEELRREEETGAGNFPADTDAVIVVGGDGTMIRAAGLVAGSIPLVGVNLGTLGFLEEIEPDHLEEMLSRLIAHDYEIEKRMMLEGEAEEKLCALNDIVIARSGSLRVLHFDIFVNDLLLATYTADGIVASTPTGSTAYNLSAGGPIVEPDAQAILLTPICPHNLNSRAIVLSPDDTVRIRIADTEADGKILTAASFDGGREIMLSPGASITIRRSKTDTKLIRLNRESFLKVLSRKMQAPS